MRVAVTRAARYPATGRLLRLAALPLCLAATPLAAETFACAFADYCDLGGDCTTLKTPEPLTLELAEASGSLDFRGERSRLVMVASSVGSRVLAGRGRRDAADMLTLHVSGGAVLTVQRLSAPDARTYSGNCKRQ